MMQAWQDKLSAAEPAADEVIPFNREPLANAVWILHGFCRVSADNFDGGFTRILGHPREASWLLACGAFRFPAAGTILFRLNYDCALPEINALCLASVFK